MGLIFILVGFFVGCVFIAFCEEGLKLYFDHIRNLDR